MKKLPQRRVVGFRGLPENGNGKQPGGACLGYDMCVKLKPEISQLISMAGDGGAISRVISQTAWSTAPKLMAEMNPQVAAAGYRAANEAFWPWAHRQQPYLKELLGIEPVHAGESWPSHFSLYLGMNVAVTESIIASVPYGEPFDVFVNDYQMARVPKQLRKRLKRLQWAGEVRIAHFVHTPWGVDLESPSITFMDEFARGPLAADVVGFQDDRWRQACVHHIKKRFPNRYWIDDSGPDPIVCRTAEGNNRKTKLYVHGIGIDADNWVRLGQRKPSLGLREGIRYIVSAARADHSKGIYESLLAFKQLFTDHPEYRGKVTFVLVCDGVRKGIEAQELYFEKCQGPAAELDAMAEGGWQPLIWIGKDGGKGLSQEELAAVCGVVDAILCASHADGWLMFIMEALMAASRNAPVAIITKNTGCARALSGGALVVDEPKDIAALADTIHQALQMPMPKRQENHALLQAEIRKYPLSGWAARPWEEFERLPV